MKYRDTQPMKAARQGKVKEELEAKHARMRARDLQRIESGEATPEEVQAENSWFTFNTFKILNFTA